MLFESTAKQYDIIVFDKLLVQIAIAYESCLLKTKGLVEVGFLTPKEKWCRGTYRMKEGDSSLTELTN